MIDNFGILWNTVDKMLTKQNLSLDAWVVLHDHFHMILKPNENVLDDFVHDLKLSFGSLFRKRYNQKVGQIWQSRFWDHIIRDQTDLNNHIDYIHYNPLKHRMVENPFQWKYSSIHEYKDYYQPDWGTKEILFPDCDFGE